MKVDTGIMAGALDDVAGCRAKELKDLGYDGLLTAETGSDPFLPLVIAAEHAKRIELGTGVADHVRRARRCSRRTPPTTSSGTPRAASSSASGRRSSHTSNAASRCPGRTRRHGYASTSWRSARDLGVVGGGDELDFRGDFYTHTLMTPFFSPGPNPYGQPKVFLAAVGELMTEVGGEVADGVIIHGFTTERYVKEVTVPAINAGWRRPAASRRLRDLRSAVRRHRHEQGGARDRQAGRAAANTFYGSTPAYRGVLELHGWGDLQPELNNLSKQGEWVKMGELIDDDVLNTIRWSPSPTASRPSSSSATRVWSTAARSTRRTSRSRRSGRP